MGGCHGPGDRAGGGTVHRHLHERLAPGDRLPPGRVQRPHRHPPGPPGRQGPGAAGALGPGLRRGHHPQPAAHHPLRRPAGADPHHPLLRAGQRHPGGAQVGGPAGRGGDGDRPGKKRLAPGPLRQPRPLRDPDPGRGAHRHLCRRPPAHQDHHRGRRLLPVRLGQPGHAQFLAQLRDDPVRLRPRLHRPGARPAAGLPAQMHSA